jgi:hypothetical protein
MKRMTMTGLVMVAAAACSGGMMPPDAGGGGGGSAAGGGFAAGGGSTGGGSGGAGGGGGGMHEILDAGVSCDGGETFTVAQATMLGSCSGFGPMNCHTRSPFDGTLDLTMPNAYSSLVNIPGSAAPDKLRVAPGDPLGSFLVQKLTNTQGPTEGAPMPQGEGILWRPPDPENLRVLECWILQGAQNN